MARKPDTRKLKVDAQKAVERGKWDRAAEAYIQLGIAEPAEALWPHRAGEAYKRVGDRVNAIGAFRKAVELYMLRGFLLKAIAVCRLILEIDAQHYETQELLGRLGSRRPGVPAVPAGAPAAAAAAGEGAAAAPPAPAAPVARPPLAPPAAAAPSAIVPPAAPAPALAVAGAAVPPRTRTVPPGARLGEAVLGKLFGGSERRPDLPAGAAERAIEIDVIEDPDIERLFAEAVSPDAPAPPPRPQISATPLFSSLSPASLSWLIEHVRFHACAAGEAIGDDRGETLHIVVSGRVEVRQDGAAVETLEDGQFFGENGLVADLPRRAEVVATRETDLLEVEAETLRQLIDREPDVLRTLIRMLRDRLVERLMRTSRLFEGLPDEQKRALTRRFRFLEVESDTQLFAEGERGPGLFVIVAGSVEVARGRDGARSRLAELSVGEVFGEISLLSGGGATASIRTLSKGWLLMLPRADFQEIIMTHPQVLIYVNELAETRRRANEGAAGRPAAGAYDHEAVLILS